MHVMRRGFRSIIAAALLLPALACPALAWAATAPPPMTAYLHPHGDATLAVIALDARYPLAQRQAAEHTLLQRADHGNAFADYAIGAQYAWGNQRPDALLPYDAAKASEYLSNAAIRGNMQAMLSLAAFDLRSGHPLQAMIWAQIYAHFLQGTPGEHPEKIRDNGYLAELIASANGRLSAQQKQHMLDDANGVLARYGARMAAGMQQREQIPAVCATRRISARRVPSFHSSAPLDSSGRMPYAGYLMRLDAIGTDGHILAAVALDAAPDWHSVWTMHYADATLRFNAAPRCTGIRVALQPIMYADRRYRLAQTGH